MKPLASLATLLCALILTLAGPVFGQSGDFLVRTADVLVSDQLTTVTATLDLSEENRVFTRQTFYVVNRDDTDTLFFSLGGISIGTVDGSEATPPCSQVGSTDNFKLYYSATGHQQIYRDVGAVLYVYDSGDQTIHMSGRIVSPPTTDDDGTYVLLRKLTGSDPEGDIADGDVIGGPNLYDMTVTDSVPDGIPVPPESVSMPITPYALRPQILIRGAENTNYAVIRVE